MIISSISHIDPERSVLLMGIGDIAYHRNEIVQFEHIEDIYKAFGDCRLARACNLLQQLMPIQNIYVLNIAHEIDGVNMMNTIANYPFAYIVPIGTYISSYFYNDLDDGKRTYIIDIMLQKLNNESQIIVTDQHAELYEDIDTYLYDMLQKSETLKQIVTIKNKPMLQQVLFVANTITDIEDSSVLVAAALVSGDMDKYPSLISTKLYNTVFEIDDTDQINDMIYLKVHTDMSITIENLLNLRPDSGLIKIQFFYRLLQHIKHYLNYDKWIGILYTPFQQNAIFQYTKKAFNKLKGKYIVDYSVDSIRAIELGGKGGIKIQIHSTIQPINTNERFSFIKEIGSEKDYG